METQEIVITVADAVQQLSELFGAKKWEEGEDRPEPSFYTEDVAGQTDFFISLKEFSRSKVWTTLAGFFDGKRLEGSSYVVVSPISTAAYTPFTIYEVKEG